MVALTFSLGQWQLSRASYKQALQAAIQASQVLPALGQEVLVSTREPATLLHRRVVLTGQWIAEETVFLDNRPMRGRPGFWVMTPLRLAGSTQSVLVQRGWIARDFADRSRLAPVQTPVGVIEIQGRMALAPAKLYEFKGGDEHQIRQNLDIPAYRTETGLPLLDALVIQTGAVSEGLLRDWDLANTGVDKHHGYAFQWFGLCALLTGLYLWFQWLSPMRDKRKKRAAPAATTRSE
jgi:surfeit locus 1 family protein